MDMKKLLPKVGGGKDSEKNGANGENSSGERKKLVKQEHSTFDDVTDFAEELGFIGPGDEESGKESHLLNTSMSSTPRSARRGGSHPVSHDATGQTSPTGGSTKTPSPQAAPEPVSKEAILTLIHILKASILVQQETADHLASKILKPLGFKINKLPSGKVTLAEMTRHLRLDRVIEAIEGAMAVEKKICSDEMLECTPLRSDIRDQLQRCVTQVKLRTEEMALEWQPALSGSRLEAKIARLQNSIEAILLELQIMIRAWLSKAKTSEGDKNIKAVQNMRHCNYKLTEMLAMLPPKYYFPDGLARSPSTTSTVSMASTKSTVATVESGKDTTDAPVKKKGFMSKVKAKAAKTAGKIHVPGHDKHDKQSETAAKKAKTEVEA